MGFYENWQKQAKEYKPKQVDQHVLWLKQMAIMSPHFKKLEISENKIQVNELWMNALCQLCYDMGAKNIDEVSYNRGHEAAWKDVASRLGFDYD